MRRYKKEAILFIMVIMVAVAGLLQLFHEEAYAIPNCSDTSYCAPNTNCNAACQCGGFVSTCDPCVNNCIH